MFDFLVPWFIGGGLGRMAPLPTRPVAFGIYSRLWPHYQRRQQRRTRLRSKKDKRLQMLVMQMVVKWRDVADSRF
jgi:hypothetical protein